MNKDDIIRMAREAGLKVGTNISGVTLVGSPFGDAPVIAHITIEELERFAAIVAAAERRKHQADIEKWKGAAVTAEKWRGMALSKDGDGRTVQAIQAEAREWERQACEKACEAIETDRWALYKGRPPYKGTEDGRASEYTQGQSDGASDCVVAIKARSNS